MKVPDLTGLVNCEQTKDKTRIGLESVIKKNEKKDKLL